MHLDYTCLSPPKNSFAVLVGLLSRLGRGSFKYITSKQSKALSRVMLLPEMNTKLKSGGGLCFCMGSSREASCPSCP